MDEETINNKISSMEEEINLTKFFDGLAGQEIKPEDVETVQENTFSPRFIESVIEQTRRIYQSDFEQKRGELESSEDRKNLKPEDVYDEHDVKLFEELG